MAKVVTLGEIMLRLSTPENERFVQSKSFDVCYGGGEANVAVSLAHYGHEAYFVSKLPNNDIGESALKVLRAENVNVDYVARGGNRIGIYYLETGSSLRASKVIYDRADSAIAKATTADFNWDDIFEGVDWFHFTGITPALGDNVAALTEAACKAAKERGITISCDLNYRNKLWSKEKARQVMTGLMQYVDVCISNEEDANDVFGIKAEDTDITGGKLNKVAYESVAKQLKEKFDFKYVAITLRTSISANDNKWAGMLYDGTAYLSKEYTMHIVDRVGGGDSFGGGLIYALLNGYDCQAAIEFAVAASCLKHSIEGDYNMVSVDEVKKLAGGDASGRVQR